MSDNAHPAETREGEKRCNGICFSAAEMGVPGYPGLIAYAHPECDLHGDPQHSDGDRP
jgi:hypothetical protein